MAYQLNDINFRTVSDPVAFMAESDESYRRKAAEAAAELARLRADSAKLAEVRRILKGART